MVTKRSIAWVAALLVTLGLAAGNATAQGKATAKREFKAGYAALQAGQYAKALSHYERSYRLVQRPRTLFNIALCEEKLGRHLASWRHYKEFLDKAEARDAPFKSRAHARIAALEKRLVGRVTVVTTPSGAKVRLDGERSSRGRTPLTLTLPPGTHVLRVSAAGATPVERTITVEPNGRSTVKLTLTLSSGVIIEAEPKDATIRRIGDPRHTRGSYKARVRAGRHRFEVSKPGYRTERITVRVRDGRVHEQVVRLRPITGTATLAVRGAGISVSIDGKTAGIVGGSGVAEYRVPAGHRDLALRSGGKTWAGRLHLSPKETATLRPRLRSPTSPLLRWGLIGVGAGAFATAGVLGVGAIRDVTGPAERHSRGKTRALIADGFIVAGVAAVFTLWRLSKRSSSSVTIERSHGGL